MFSNSHTLLYFSLPLTDTTDGLPISCQSENIVSQSITLQSSKNVEWFIEAVIETAITVCYIEFGICSYFILL